jgi:hypothetical protein
MGHIRNESDALSARVTTEFPHARPRCRDESVNSRDRATRDFAARPRKSLKSEGRHDALQNLKPPGDLSAKAAAPPPTPTRNMNMTSPISPSATSLHPSTFSGSKDSVANELEGILAESSASLHPGTFDAMIREKGRDWFLQFVEANPGTPIARSDLPADLDVELGIDLTEHDPRVLDVTAYVHWGRVYVRTIADGGFGGTMWKDLGPAPLS